MTPLPPFVLVVDDCHEDRVFLHRAFRHVGVDVVDVSDGIDALAWLQENRSTLPALLVIDHLMRQMDGLRLLQALALDPVLRSIPAVVISGQADEHARAAVRATHALACLPKPDSLLQYTALAVALAKIFIERRADLLLLRTSANI